MSEILVRPLKEEDLDGFYTVRALTYNNGDAYPPERIKMDGPELRSFVAIHNGQVSGVSTILNIFATRGNAVLPCAGVAGVAVLPEKRKSGVGSAMMSWLVNHFQETNTPLASLYAYRETFYRKFGYETAGRRMRVTCPTDRLPKVSSDLEIRRLGPKDWRELVECYTKFAHKRSGLNIRSELMWQRVLGENRPLTIYALGNPVEAYAVVSHKTDFWTTDHISEAVWSTRRGYDGLLALYRGITMNKRGISWHEPSDGAFYGCYLDEGVEVKLERPAMFRVNDVGAAFELLKPNSEYRGSFSVKIDDPICSHNQGVWNVEFDGGVVRAEKHPTGENHDFGMTIQSFAQAFLGEPGLGQLASTECIQVNSERSLETAKLLLPDQSTCCMDFF